MTRVVADVAGPRLNRRRFITITGSTALVAALPGSMAAAAARVAPAAGRGDAAAGGSFAVVADSHIDPFAPNHSVNLGDVYGHIAGQPVPPAFVFHVGDVVEAGLPGEYEEYDRVEPAALRDLVRAVPGNHEVRWDEWAKQRYAERFAPSSYSFDALGLHVAALDPTQLLQEPGYFTKRQLRWLDEDLGRVPRGTPSLVFVHYPMGNDNYYIGNTDAFFATVGRHDVCALFAGHIHREQVWRQNGMTLVTLPGVLNGPAYHQVERTVDGQGRATLAVRHVELDRTTGIWGERALVDVPLEGPGPAASERPRAVQLRGGGRSGRLIVQLEPGSRATAVRYQFTPEFPWGVKNAGAFTDLPRTGRGSLWRGEVDLSASAPGTRRLQVRVVAEDGAWWDEFTDVAIEPSARGAVRVRDERPLGEPVQAGIAVARDDAGVQLVVATSGESGAVTTRVTALRGAAGGLTRAWTADVEGPVIGTPAVSGDGATAFVGSAGQVLTALRADTGATRWTVRTDRPVLAAPTWAPDADRAGGVVVVPSGRTLYLLDGATGEEVWRAGVGGFVGGQAAVDDRGVYVGAGDGDAQAFDRRTGASLWETVVDRRTRPYTTLIYSPWGTHATLLPGAPGTPGLVVVSTVTRTWALDRASGAVVWQLAGGYMYSAPLVMEQAGQAVLASELGDVIAIDPVTGLERWRVKLSQRVIDSAPVLWRDTVCICGVNGALYRLDPATGELVEQRFVTTDYVFSTPAVAGGVLVTGGQDGVLRVIA